MTLPTDVLKRANQKLVCNAVERDLCQEGCIPLRVEEGLPLEAQQLIERGLKVLHHLADVRSERIEALHIQIATGIYRIDTEAIAQKMLGIDQYRAGEADEVYMYEEERVSSVVRKG